MHWIGLLVQAVLHNTVNMAKVIWNFTLQNTPWENAKYKAAKFLHLQNQIKMQLIVFYNTVCLQ